jgi:hypothetical protein
MAKTYHEKLVDKASEYIRRIHSDTSVSPKQVAESLVLLYDRIVDILVELEESDG